MIRNAFLSILVVLLFSSLVFSACPFYVSVDAYSDQGIDLFYPMCTLNHYSGIPSGLLRGYSNITQTFKPSVSGEMPYLNLTGFRTEGQTTDTEKSFSPVDNHTCYDSSSSYTSISSTYPTIAQRIYVTDLMAWGTISIPIVKGYTSAAGDIAISIQGDTAGAPNGIPINGIYATIPGNEIWNNLTVQTYAADFSDPIYLFTSTYYWIVIELAPDAPPGTSYFISDYTSGGCRSDATQYFSTYSGGAWHPVAGAHINLALNAYGYPGFWNNYLCARVYSGAPPNSAGTFLKAAKLNFTNASHPGYGNEWSEFTSWYTDELCTAGATSTGPTVTAGSTYSISVIEPLYGDNAILYSSGPDLYTNGSVYYSYFNNPTYTNLANGDLRFQTWACTSKAPNGGSCGSGSDCWSGYCNNSICCYQGQCCPTPGVQGPCPSSPSLMTCQSDYHCGGILSGGECSEYWQCSLFHCNNGFCCIGGTCCNNPGHQDSCPVGQICSISYVCVGATPTPTASVTPTPPIACTSTMDCPYAYNCDTAMHLCYPRAQKYQQWGLEWIGLFFQMNTVYIIVVGAIILIFLVALPTLSRAREE